MNTFRIPIHSNWLRVPSVILLATVFAQPIAAQTTIAKQDFDGGQLNLVSGFNPTNDNLDGGPGDYFGVGNILNWPQGFGPGVPFGLADDTVTSVSNPANPPFPADREGIFGLASDPNNDFFAISDTREWTASQLVAAWTFNVAGGAGNDLLLKLDLGQQSDGASFGGITAGSVLVEYSFDGGNFQTAMICQPASATSSGFLYRAMDDGSLPTTASAMQASGPNGVTKISAVTQLVVANNFLDKAPNQTSANPSRLDSYIVPLSGSGQALQIRITANLPFEGMAIDNIEILADEPDFILGDANGDGAFDFGDIEPFVLALSDPTAFMLQFPNVDVDQVLDFDGDGVFTFGDIEGFVNGLIG